MELCLKEKERNLLPKESLVELEKLWITREEEIERLRSNNDQGRFLLEKELVGLRSKIVEDAANAGILNQKLEDCENQVESLRKDQTKSRDQNELLTKQFERFESEQSNSSKEVEVITSTLQSRSRLVDDLKQQVLLLEERLARAQNAKCEALIHAEEASSRKTHLEVQGRRYELEKTLMSRQVAVLQHQLEQRAEEMLAIRRDHSKALLGLQAECTRSQEELKTMKEERASNLKNLNEKTKRVEELLASLSETSESEARLEETFRQELSAQEKLAAIYKDSSEDQKKRCAELEEGIEELRTLLQDASDQFGALERTKEKGEQDAAIQLESRTRLCKELQEENEKINKILGSSVKKENSVMLSEISPAAAAARELMNKGMTLSQLYMEFLSVSDKLYESEEENKRLTRYIDQILHEIEEKTPIMKRQREDYDRAMQTIDKLHQQIEDSIEDVEKQRFGADEHKRRADYLLRENSHLTQQTKDLSRQVSVLLTQVEAARMGLPPPPMNVLDDMNMSGSSANAVISQHLVTFRDVSELQEQNRKILASLRDVTDKIETDESDAISSTVKKLRKELESARSELEELQEQRDKTEEIVSNLQRQRDLYRTLANQEKEGRAVGSRNTSFSESRNMSFTEVKSTSFHAPQEDESKLKTELEEVKNEREKAKNDLERYRESDSKNKKALGEEIERLRKMYEQTKQDNVKLLSQAEYSEERLKVLENNANTLQRQVNELTESNQNMHGVISKHEVTVSMLRDHVYDLTKKLNQLEMMTTNLREERSMLKENEARQLNEIENLSRAQKTHALLMSSFESLKNNIEVNETEQRSRLQGRVEELTLENQKLKSKIQSSNEVVENQAMLTSANDSLALRKKEIEMFCQERLNETKQAVAQLESRQEMWATPISRHTVMSPSPSMCGVEGEEMSSSGISKHSGFCVIELKAKLVEEQEKVCSMQFALQQTQDTIVAMKKSTEQQDSKIAMFQTTEKASRKEVDVLQKNVNELNEVESMLRAQLKEFGEMEIALKDTMNDQLMKLTEDLEGRENEMEEVQRRLDEKIVAEDKMKKLYEVEKSKLEDVQDKYQREVMLHASDIEIINRHKNHIAQLNVTVESLTQDRLREQENYNDAKEKFEAQDAKFQKTNLRLTSRIEELEENNAGLVEQLAKISDKMAIIEGKLRESDESGVNASFTEDEMKSSDQLRVVIKYLRKEIEVYGTKAEIATTELQQMVAQNKVLESEVKRLDKEITEEREKNKLLGVDDSKNAELLRRVQALDAVSDSNKLMREEKEQILANIEEAKIKILSLENQIQPLQDINRDYTNQLEELDVKFKAMEEERNLFKIRSQELVDKLNKARPEDMLILQKQLDETQKEALEKSSEIKSLKNFVANVQKLHQTVMAERNQMQSRMDNAMQESRIAAEEGKKLSLEKQRLQTALKQHMEKSRQLEGTVQQVTNSKQQAQAKFVEKQAEMEQNLEKIQKSLKEKETELEEMEAKRDTAVSRTEEVTNHCVQLRKIATKYKKKAEAAQGSGAHTAEVDANQGDSEKVKELEERNNALQSQLEASREELARLSVLPEKDGDQGSYIAQFKSQLSSKTEELLKSNAIASQLKANLTKQGEAIKKMQEENHTKLSSYEDKIGLMEREMEMLNKKLNLQQRQIEIMQKQPQGVSKGSSAPRSQEKAPSEPPPTANIKPMASPAVPVSSPRSQSSSQSGSGPSRSIPTASIRPMAPPHSGGEGAVSSTVVTLPQATVTPNPAVPSSTPQSFTSTLTATVSPTPVSTSLASSGPYIVAPQTQQQQAIGPVQATVQVVPQNVPVAPENVLSQSGADDLISQALALVNPQGLERMEAEPTLPGPSGSLASTYGQPSLKRKLQEDDSDLEEVQEDTKRGRVLEEGEERGEPSSSSNSAHVVTGSSHAARHPAHPEEDDNIVLSSDDEQPPSSPGEEDDDDDNDDSPPAEGDQSLHEEISTDAPGEARSTIQPSEAVEQGSARASALSTSHEPPSSSLRPPLSSSFNVQYEDGDDRIVPSTPTFRSILRGESAQNDGVSSPQVPSHGFIFGAQGAAGQSGLQQSHGLAQMAESGHLNGTHVDLHLDERKHSQVRQQITTEQLPEGSISSSGGETGSSAVQASSQVVTISQGEEGGVATSEAEADHDEDPEPDSGLAGVSKSKIQAEASYVESSQERGIPTHRDSTDDQDIVEDEDVSEDEEEDGEISESSSPQHSRLEGSPSLEPRERRVSPMMWSPRRRIRGAMPHARGSLQSVIPPSSTTVRPTRGTPARGGSARRSRPGQYGRGGASD